MGSLLLSLGPGAHTTLCVPSRSGVSVSPSPVEVSCSQIPLAFKVWFSRNSSSYCQTPRFESLTWGSEPSLQWVDFCGISVLQFVSHPPSSYRIRFYCDCAPPTVSLWLLLCLWMWGIFFGGCQCLPVDDCSTVSCDSGALARGRRQRANSCYVRYLFIGCSLKLYIIVLWVYIFVLSLYTHVWFLLLTFLTQ